MLPSILSAQNSFDISLGYNWLNHSKLHGLYLSNEVCIGKTNKFLTIGVDLNFGEGNRGVDFNDYKGIYRFKSTESSYEEIWGFDEGMLYSIPVELDIKSATTYQATVKTGFKYILSNYDKITLNAGMYFTYVNKAYIVKYYEGLGVYDMLAVDDGTADFAIPYNLRYIDIGPYFGLNYTFLKWEKYRLGFNFCYNIGFSKNSWLNSGFVWSVDLTK